MSAKNLFIILFLICSNFVFGLNPGITHLKTDYRTTPLLNLAGFCHRLKEEYYKRPMKFMWPTT